MRTYGYRKATEFTKKQINVIYAKAKNGELKIQKWAIERMYNAADYYGVDFNNSMESEEGSILGILKSVFENDIEEAQRLIDIYIEFYGVEFHGAKSKKLDRTLIA